MSKYKTVTLTELEFNKLLRFSEAAIAAEAQAELVVKQLRTQVEAARKTREDYFESLSSKYPDLDKNISYTPVEAEFQLQPNIVEE